MTYRSSGVSKPRYAYRLESNWYIIDTRQIRTSSQRPYRIFDTLMIQIAIRALIHNRDTVWYTLDTIWDTRADTEVGYTHDTTFASVPDGYVIFFRADFWHCGGPFLSGEPRFHGFQLHCTVGIPGAVYTWLRQWVYARSVWLYRDRYTVSTGIVHVSAVYLERLKCIGMVSGNGK